MANSASTITPSSYNGQPGNLGRMRAERVTITFGADYAAAVLPLIAAADCGLTVVHGVIVEGAASGTAIGATVVPAIATDGGSFTLKLFNGTTAIGTVDESATTVKLLVLGY